MRWRLMALMICFAALIGCGATYSLPEDKIVSDGPAPTTVLLTKVPAKGESHTVDYDTETFQPDNGQKDISTSKLVSEVEDEKSNEYTVHSHVTDFQMPRNDFGVNVEELKAASNGLDLHVTMNKQGDYLAGGVKETKQVSYHFPKTPLKKGDKWEGWAGEQDLRETVDFTLEDIVHAKGHDLAVFSYKFTDKRQHEITVREWLDVASGWVMKTERSYHRNMDGRDVTVTSRSCDPIFEN